MSDLVKIRDVSCKYGLSPRALRYYEDAGLLTSIRTEGYAYRVYDENAVKRLEQILILRKLNISIKDIKRMANHDIVVDEGWQITDHGMLPHGGRSDHNLLWAELTREV